MAPRHQAEMYPYFTDEELILEDKRIEKVPFWIVSVEKINLQDKKC